MGRIKRILAAGVPPLGPYAPETRLELAETLHLHHDSFRLEFGYDAGRAVVDMIDDARREWEARLWPHCLAPDPNNNNIIRLASRSPTPPTMLDRFEIEEAEDATIHVHLRNLRFTFDRAGFLEFAAAVAQAAEALR